MGARAVSLRPGRAWCSCCVLEHSTSEAARGRTGSVEQSGREGEGRGAVQKVRLVPVQVAPIGSTVLEELPKLTQTCINPVCPGAALAHASAPTGWHVRLSPAGSSPGENLSQRRLPGGGSGRAEPLPCPWSVPQSPWPAQGSSMPCWEKHEEGGSWSQGRQTRGRTCLVLAISEGLRSPTSFPGVSEQQMKGKKGGSFR